VEGLQIVLVVAATLVIVSLLAVVPLVAGRRRRRDAGTARQVDLDREPGVGDDAGQPPPPGREVADVDLPPDDRSVATAAPPAPDDVIAPRRRFRERLGRSRAALSRGLSGLLARGADDDEAWDELEEALLSADVGVATATELVERLRTRARAERASGPALRELLRSELLDAVGRGDRSLALDLPEEHQRPGIILVVAPVVRHQQGADPAAVAFDGLASARARGADVLLVDTAGRLHTKTNLMEELRKLRRVLEREGGQVREVLLVLDATTGQNGLAQARQFTDAVGVTGVVLTKLDGTAKGGIVIAVQRELGIPVKLVGLGEGAHDLAPFDPDAFVDALLSEDGS